MAIRRSSSSISAACFPTSNSSNVAAFVPFLWEEKPGVSKQCKSLIQDTEPREPERLKIVITDPLPRPPRLQTSNKVGEKIPGDIFTPSVNRTELQRRSTVDRSSPTKKRPPRKLRARDDPFLMAIQACTKESSNSNGLLEVRPSKHSQNLSQMMLHDEDEPNSLRMYYSSHHHVVSVGSLQPKPEKDSKLEQNGYGKNDLSRTDQWLYNSTDKSKKFSSISEFVIQYRAMPACDESNHSRSIKESELLQLVKRSPKEEVSTLQVSKCNNTHAGLQYRLGRCLGCKEADSYDSIVKSVYPQKNHG